MMSKPHEVKFKKFIQDNPDVAKAFKETLDEVFSPDNVQQMSTQITKVLDTIQKNLQTQQENRRQ